MAGRGTSILWFFVKWMVIPIGLAAIGYFFVGPRIGGADREPEQASESSTAGPETENTNHARQAAHSEPEIEIQSRPVSTRRRTNRLQPKPKEEQKPPKTDDPSQDPGSVGGTTDPPSDQPVEPTTGGGGGDGAGIGG